MRKNKHLGLSDNLVGPFYCGMISRLRPAPSQVFQRCPKAVKDHDGCNFCPVFPDLRRWLFLATVQMDRRHGQSKRAQPLAVVVHFTRLVPLRIDLCPLALLPDQGSAAEATHARLVGRSCRHLLKHREGLSRVCPGETIRFGLSGLHAGMLERERV